jgi:hypothetical protein
MPTRCASACIARFPNPFLRTIALDDSLALGLTGEQQGSLRAKGDSLQVRADSIVAKIAEVLRGVGTNPDPQTTMFRMRDNVQARSPNGGTGG